MAVSEAEKELKEDEMRGSTSRRLPLEKDLPLKSLTISDYTLRLLLPITVGTIILLLTNSYLWAGVVAVLLLLASLVLVTRGNNSVPRRDLILALEESFDSITWSAGKSPNRGKPKFFKDNSDALTFKEASLSGVTYKELMAFADFTKVSLKDSTVPLVVDALEKDESTVSEQEEALTEEGAVSSPLEEKEMPTDKDAGEKSHEDLPWSHNS